MRLLLANAVKKLVLYKWAFIIIINEIIAFMQCFHFHDADSFRISPPAHHWRRDKLLQDVLPVGAFDTRSLSSGRWLTI